MTLFSRTDPGSSNSGFSTLLPFSVPITSDTPQCIHSPLANITHRLTVALHPSTANRQSIEKSVIVHTRRYSSRFSSIPVSPESLSITEPTRVEIQLPRRTYRAGEIIPVYVTVPPLERSLLLQKQLIL